MSVKSALAGILCKVSSCALCYNVLADVFYLEDEVVFSQDHSNNSDLKLSDILSTVLGLEMVKSIHQYNAICGSCVKSAIDSYRFIIMCKEKFLNFNNALNSLKLSMDFPLDDPSVFKTLFVSLNTKEYSSREYYVTGRRLKTPAMALQKFLSVCKTNVQVQKAEEYEVEKNKSNKLKHEKPVKDKLPIEDIVYNIAEKNLRCKICLKTLSSIFKLRRHFINIHSPKDYQCDECPKLFGSHSLLNKHKHSSHCNVLCKECGKTYTSRYSLRVHEESHKPKRRVCPDCGRVYKTRRTYYFHKSSNLCGQTKRKSKEDAIYACNQCSKVFALKDTLVNHISFEHGDSKAYICRWCHKRFRIPSALTKHIVTHTKEKKFECTLCGGKFVSEESLLYHTRTHTGERPYQCEYCGRYFLNASRRTDHIKRQHNRKTTHFDCDYCGMRFYYKPYLTKHITKHVKHGKKLEYNNIVRHIKYENNIMEE